MTKLLILPLALVSTLAAAENGVPDAKVYSLAISKGRDYAFSGAVDDLVINDTMYDFEPTGVIEGPAPS